MPVKWTPDNDQLLLLKILETHDLSVDTKKVAGAWPGADAKDKPTPRAITERLVRMRQMAKSAGGNAGSFAISKGSGASRNPSTPTKPGRSTASTPASEKASSSKRKIADTNKGDAMDGDEDDDEMDEAETPSKAPKVKHEDVKGIKLELVELGGVENIPCKRSRRASRLPIGMVDYSDAEDGTECESSASEFVPEEFLRDEAVKKEEVEDSSLA